MVREGKPMNNELVRTLDFITYIDKLKSVFRQNYIADASRRENDAEHSWHLALCVMLLSDYAAEPVNREKTMQMVLIHDLVELFAGDTYCYDDTAKLGQSERERQAAIRLAGMLPEDKGQWLFGLWTEFEEMKSPESRFAKAMDRLQPVLLNIAGKGRSWVEHGIVAQQVCRRNEPLSTVAPELWEYLEPAIRNTFAEIDNGRHDSAISAKK